MKKVVEHKQSVLDMCIQHFGKMDSLFGLTTLNNLSITDDLVYGSYLEIGTPESNEVIETYIEKNIIPATDLDRETQIVPEGIGYWIIGTDFKVS